MNRLQPTDDDKRFIRRLALIALAILAVGAVCVLSTFAAALALHMRRETDVRTARVMEEARIEAQSNMLASQIDALKGGVSAMVDADMEEASARLAALQTQQQLGIQALSIANSAPQNVLSLFRN